MKPYTCSRKIEKLNPKDSTFFNYLRSPKRRYLLASYERKSTKKPPPEKRRRKPRNRVEEPKAPAKNKKEASC